MNNIISTPFIHAQKDDFAKTVLMPGDPLRSQYIAENYLKNIKLVNNLRDIKGYTGEYKGVKISVMASGMGNPSMGVYSYELYNFFNVENIIRIGSAGSISHKLKLNDIVVGLGVSGYSNYASQFNMPGYICPIASYKLIKKSDEIKEKLGLKNIFFGNILSHDMFYNDTQKRTDYEKIGILASEMESYALYLNAMKEKKHAITLCTISDILATGESLTSEQREKSFNEMIYYSLEIAISL